MATARRGAFTWGAQSVVEKLEESKQLIPAFDTDPLHDAPMRARPRVEPSPYRLKPGRGQAILPGPSVGTTPAVDKALLDQRFDDSGDGARIRPEMRRKVRATGFIQYLNVNQNGELNCGYGGVFETILEDTHHRLIRLPKVGRGTDLRNNAQLREERIRGKSLKALLCCHHQKIPQPRAGINNTGGDCGDCGEWSARLISHRRWPAKPPPPRQSRSRRQRLAPLHASTDDSWDWRPGPPDSQPVQPWEQPRHRLPR